MNRTPNQQIGEKPIIASVKTGLTPKDDAVMRKLPREFSEKTIDDVIRHMTLAKGLKDVELSVAKSVKREMSQQQYAIVVNGVPAKGTDHVGKYLADKMRTVNGQNVQYQPLDIEISAVEDGGYCR
ncbi:MAG: hypothetical protein V1725_05005 [archaeon]